MLGTERPFAAPVWPCIAGATSEHFVSGTSSVLWPAASKLVEVLGAKPFGAWSGRRVLELGAGVGLVGAACAALGASVVVTDCQVAMLLLRRNQERSSLGA